MRLLGNRVRRLRRRLAGVVAPTAEVEDFIERHDNHFSEIDAAAESLRAEYEQAGAGIDAWLVDHLLTRHGVVVKVVPSGASPGPLVHFDDADRLMVLSELLPASNMRAQTLEQAPSRSPNHSIGRQSRSPKFFAARWSGDLTGRRSSILSQR